MAAHAGAYRRTRGRAGRRWFGAPVLLLDVVGRKTGRLRSTPLIYLPVPDGYVVAAADAGNDREPQWWRNLRTAGTGMVHVDGRTERVHARLVEPPERDELWANLVAAYPAVGEYGRYTDRVFPVVVLERR
ncbi:MAG: nitroreductase family deazaflavin-dependent oxidoreductase [Actinobacteria bacterium]|nr:nitroreductase family deazaflavin-dependent oxidoreductase [Actinomycetota bacterium]